MADTPTIPNALTDAEWAEQSTKGADAFRLYNGTVYVGGYAEERPHAVAALCLYGQTFGFTAEDVENVEAAAEEFPRRHEVYVGLMHLAAKLRALLPPEAP